VRSVVSFCVIAAVFGTTIWPAFAYGQNFGQNPVLRASDALPVDSAASAGRYIIEVHQFGPQVLAAVRAAGGTVIYEFPSYSVVAAQLPAWALQVLCMESEDLHH
jgi:hypothetical protein